MAEPSPDRLPLFRPEALAHGHAPSLLGDVVLARPLSHRVLAMAALSTGVAILVFLCAGSYTRKLEVAGILVPDRGLVRVVSPQQATVVRRFHVDGQRVAAGETLYELSLDRNGAGGRGTEAEAAAQARDKLTGMRESLDHQTRLLRDQLTALKQRSLRLEDEAEQASAQLSLTRERVALAEATLSRYRQLADQRFVSELQLREKQQALLDQKFLQRDAQRALSGARRQREEVQSESESIAIRISDLASTHRRDAAGVGQELAEIEGRRALVVKAPVAGTATASTALAGATVSTGAGLVSIVPAGSSLQAELYAPSRAIGFVRPGLGVRLRFRAFPYETYGLQRGSVSAVSAVPIAPLDLPAGVADSREPLYRIIIALPSQTLAARGTEWPLAPGMALDADLLLENRRLIEWLFAPLTALRS